MNSVIVVTDPTEKALKLQDSKKNRKQKILMWRYMKPVRVELAEVASRDWVRV